MTAAVETEIRAEDNVRLLTRKWLPEGDARAIVLLSHGLGEHSARYQPMADSLVTRGFAVYAIDHRGHGRSGGLRGHADEFSEFVRDLRTFLKDIRAEQGDELPLFVFGHSMGGLIAVLLMVSEPDFGEAGVILSNPLLDLAFQPPKIKVAAGRLLSRILPRLRLGNELDPNEISRDEAEVRAYIDDPLVHDKISTRCFVTMTEAMEQARGSAARMTVPTLWILGGQDKIVSAPAARGLAEQLPAGRTKIVEFKDARHEPHNGPDRAAVLETLGDWIEEQLASA